MIQPGNLNGLLMILLMVLLSACSCNRLNNADRTTNEIQYTRAHLIQEIIDLPALQEYLRVQEVFKQKDLVILKNDYVTGLDSMIVYHRPVKFLTYNQILRDSLKAFIEVKDMTIRNDTALVYYVYDVQSVGVKASYVYRNKKWSLISCHLWEYK